MQNFGQLNISTLCQTNLILLKTQQVFMFNFWKFVFLPNSPHLRMKRWSPYVVEKIKITIIEDKYKIFTSVISRRDGSAPLHDHKCWTGGSESSSSSSSSSSTSSSPLSPSFSSPFPSSVVSTCSPPTSQISWIRLADYRILTNGLLTFTTDDRLPQNIFEQNIFEPNIFDSNCKLSIAMPWVPHFLDALLSLVLISSCP